MCEVIGNPVNGMMCIVHVVNIRCSWEDVFGAGCM